MLCFEVTINGKKMCTAGVEDYGVLSTIFSWYKNPPPANMENTNDSQMNEPHLSVGGFVKDTHVECLSGVLEIGDEVTIRIIESDQADEPRNELEEDPE